MKLSDDLEKIRNNIEDASIYNASTMIEIGVKAEVSKALKGEFKRAWDSGYRHGLEKGLNNAAKSDASAYAVGYESGQKELLEALRVIAKKYPSFVHTVIKERGAVEIFELAKRYLEIENSVNSEKRKDEEFIVRCMDCKWNSGTPAMPYCQLQSQHRIELDFCSHGERKLKL